MTVVLDRFRLLEKVIRISNSTVDIERRLKNLLQLFQREIGVDKVYLFNLDKDAKALRLRASADQDDSPNLTINLADNSIGEVARKLQPSLGLIEETVKLPEECRSFFEEFVSLASFPIMDDQVLYGVLTLLHKKQQEFDQEWVALIETIAREMAGTIRNSLLYAESKKRIAELSVLYEVGRAVGSTIDLDKVLDTVVNITCKVLLAQGCTINVIDLPTGILRIAAEYGVIPRGCSFKYLLGKDGSETPLSVIECVSRNMPYVGPASGTPFCAGMREEDAAKSVISLPVHFKGRFRGNLSVFNKSSAPPGRPREFNREDLELLTTMAVMISSSLENALTFQAVDELARHNELLVRNLSCLYEISGAMMTTVKLNELLSIITNALTLGQGLGFDRAFILLINDEEDCLVGAAMKQVTLEQRALENKKLTDLLKDGLIAPSEPTPSENKFLSVRLRLDEGDGVLVRTAREKKAFTVTPGHGDYLVEESLPAEFGASSFTTVPMLAKGTVMGVIAVDRDLSRTETTAEDLRNLSMLANQAGLAIENSRLYEYIETANEMLSQTKERLLEAEKLAALGEMAAGMAHEIRNPLVSIGGFTRRLLKSLDADSPHKVYVEVIINEVTRLEKTLSEVLDFSRDTLGHLAEHNINDIIADSLFVLRRDFKEGRIEVVKEFGTTQPVLVDEGQIKHVFFNLFFNASQAMDKGGTLTVKTYPVVIEDRAFVACEVSDTGPGISPEVLPNIFNPFFTTKDAGTGLGLSIVHKIVSRHHGHIDVVHRENQGATFIVKLPLAAEAGLYLK
jgi:signal transduction histidine kinase